MTQSEAVARFLKGDFIILAEFRGSVTDHIKWRDKTTGRAVEADTVRHNLEVGARAVAFEDRPPDDCKDVAGWVASSAPFTKGQQVALIISSLNSTKGAMSARGRLEAVTADPVARK